MAAIRLMVTMLSSIGVDLETGAIDVGMIMTGASFHQRKLMSVVSDVVKKLTGGDATQCAKVEAIIQEVARATKAPRERIERVVQRMMQEGMLYERRPGCLQVVD